MKDRLFPAPGRAALLALAIAWLAVGWVWAAPFAKRIAFTQPDGTRIELWGEGDEFHAVFETLDGFTVVFDPQTRAYHYARLSPDGHQLVSTGVPVGAGDPRNLGLPVHLRIRPEAVRAQAAERRRWWEEAMRIPERWQELKWTRRAKEAAAESELTPPPPRTPTLGNKLGLCLLIDFEDDVATVPRAAIEGFCNGDAFTAYGNNGSVKQYFQDNSNGLLTYSNVVTRYVRIPNSLRPKSYYNDTSQESVGQANLLIRDAIALLRALPDYATQILPLFDALDLDEQGQVLALNVFYAGDNGGVWSRGLWPHAGTLNLVGPQELSPGGKQVFRYQISNIGSSLELGTFCHETGHLLCGYPDLYDYGFDSFGGAGRFCLMGQGGQGPNPVQISAYLKNAAGWATLTDLNRASSLAATLAAAPGPGFNHFYRHARPGVPTEYFLAENRQQTGRDAGLPASGIAIWHIDELGDSSNQNLLPNASHQNYEATLVQADNRWDLQRNVNTGDPDDLYHLGNWAPGYSNLFSDTTAPDARWWDWTPSGIHWSDFSANSLTMTFRVKPAPTPGGYIQTRVNAAARGSVLVIPAGTYRENVFIDKDLTLQGAGSGTTVVDGAGFDTALRIAAGATVQVRDFTIRNGLAAEGGGVWNAGTLTLSAVAVCNNTAFDGGGGIRNHGVLILDACLVVSNVLNGLGAGGGAGLLNSGTGTLHQTQVEFNRIPWELDGSSAGGINNHGTLTVHQSSISHNTGGGHTGGLRNRGSAFLIGTLVRSNSAGLGVGGIRNDGTMVLRDCTVADNTAENSAGIVNGAGRMMLTNCTISGNVADIESGGIGNAAEGILALHSCTVSSNRVRAFGAGGVFNFGGLLALRNTLVAGNTGDGPVGNDCQGEFISGGYNLIQDPSGFTLSGDLTGNVLGQPALLGPLQPNGGPTPTHAPQPGSPALDRGNCAGLGTDQRGFSRPIDLRGVPNAGDACDIGAYESCPDIYLHLEAEAGRLTAPMIAAHDPEASQGRFVFSPTANQGSVAFTVAIPEAGAYLIWCRVLAPSFNADSFLVSADGANERIYDVAEGLWSNSWQWTRVNGRLSGEPVNLNPRIFNLSAGNHTILFRARDPNTKLDRLLLTNHPDFVPVNAPPRSPATVAERLPGGVLRFRFYGEIGRTCRIEATPTLSPPQWITVKTHAADCLGLCVFEDVPIHGTRYYRVIDR